MGCSSSNANVSVASASTVHHTSAKTLKPLEEDILDNHIIGELIKSGLTGHVRKLFLKGNSSEVRAVKIVHKNGIEGVPLTGTELLGKEAWILQEIQHENIVRLYGYYQDQYYLYAVMELCSGGEVFDSIVEKRRFPESMAAVMGTQMLWAIEYIHSRKIMHRDIKAENFMWSGSPCTSRIVMIDFGTACEFKEGQYLSEVCGSPHYLAPELIGQKYQCKADIWSFGVLMYLLIYGRYPFNAEEPREIMVKILCEPIPWQTRARLMPTCLDFLYKVLEYSPLSRVSATEALRHAWIVCQPDDEIQGDQSCLQEEDSSESNDLLHEKLRKGGQRQVHVDRSWNPGKGSGGMQERMTAMSRPEFLRRDNRVVSAPSRPSYQLRIGGEGGLSSSERADEEATQSQPRSKTQC